MALYALTIFLSAFLLFLVQPVMAKQILPWFGGSAAVWTTCLVFFQAALLAGYAYSDLTIAKLSPRRQVGVHLLLLAVSLAMLPIVPAAYWKPGGDENPSWLILGLLAATIGLPYFVLSTTSPLIQAWFARTRPGASPYRLFALSNLASMLALLGYPVVLEPWVATRTQAIGWSAGYGCFVLLCAVTAWRSLQVAPEAAAARPASSRATGPSAPTLGTQALWGALAAAGSVLLLAVSNHITQNVAAVPLLWIAPLAIYLLSFILTFDSSGWYRRDVMLPAAAIALGAMAWMLADSRTTHVLSLQLGVFCTGLLLACMFCHGELARSKPAPEQLTRFYLMISIGGALGSALVGIVAPLVLPAYFEMGLGLVAGALLMLICVRRDTWVLRGLACGAVLVAIGCTAWNAKAFYEDTIVTARNFYGVLRVLETGKDASAHRSLVHGTILHGTQYLAPELRHRPTTYYTESSGIGRLLEGMHPTLTPVKVGVIGLGTGTLASYGAAGDTYRFYDINPAVAALARTAFTYLGDSEATVEIAIGDARLNLEREAPQNFDVLAIDAFSSDAIPMHLITLQALDVYLRHMKPSGVIAFHVTNRFLDLVPVVSALANARGLEIVHLDDDGDESLASRSDWILLARDRAPLDKEDLAESAVPVRTRPDWRLWTDDFNNLVQVLKR